MATVPHVTSGSGLWKFQADGFLFHRVYHLCGGGHQALPTASLFPSSCPIMVWFYYVTLDQMVKYYILGFQLVFSVYSSHHIISYTTMCCTVYCPDSMCNKWLQFTSSKTYAKWKILVNYRGAGKSLARPGRNKLQRQKILSFIYLIYNHNSTNISTIYIYNKTSIKRNILTIKQNTSGSRSG